MNASNRSSYNDIINGKYQFMATIFSHPAAALALFPWFKSVGGSKAIIVTGMLLTAAPDLDVIGLHLGIPYSHMLGHRGLTHSIFFAAIFCFLLIAFIPKKPDINRFSIWIYFAASMSSHGVLDALTNGGLGVAFFAPFTSDRYFLPFRPIEVSTLNITHFFQGQGVGVLLSELMWVWPPALLVCLFGFLLTRR